MNRGANAENEVAESLDVSTFRAAMGTFATGVTVVTVKVDRELYGLTVNSFTSLSLDPMLVLICLNESSRAVELLAQSGAFSVNVLSAEQIDVSRRFADKNRPTGAAAFDGVPFVLGLTGAPSILDCATSLDCQVRQTFPGGDHLIVIGRVIALTTNPDRDPLVFHAGSYRPLSEGVPHRAAWTPSIVR